MVGHIPDTDEIRVRSPVDANALFSLTGWCVVEPTAFDTMFTLLCDVFPDSIALGRSMIGVVLGTFSRRWIVC